MVKVSELLSKQLICLDTATIEGTICNITFDSRLKEGKFLELFCEDDITPEKKFVLLKNVSALNSDAAVIKSSCSIIYEWHNDEGGFNPINCACYNSVGESLGFVRDIVLDGAKVDKIILSSRDFTPKELLSYSDNLLIFNDTGKPIKISKPKTKFPQINSSATAQIHNSQDTQIQNSQATQENNSSALQENNSSALVSPYLSQNNIPLQGVLTAIPKADSENKRSATTPIFITPNSTKVVRSPQGAPRAEDSYKFLLGKTLHSNITDNSGAIIISENTQVTDATITTARASGKLVQLALRAY